MPHRLPKVIWEHTKAGIPDPCIKVRKGSGKTFAGLIFNPLTSILIETGQYKNNLKKLKKAKKVKRCLW